MDAYLNNSHTEKHSIIDDHSTTISQGDNVQGLQIGINKGTLIVIYPDDRENEDFKQILKEALGGELSLKDLDNIINQCYNYVKAQPQSEKGESGVPLQQVIEHVQTINEPINKIRANTEDILQKIVELSEKDKKAKKKKLKRKTFIISIMAVIVVIFLIGGGIALWHHFRPTGFEYEGFWININEDGETVTVSINTQKEGTEIEFPTSVSKDGKEYRVTRIGKAVMAENDKIKSINMTTSIERIEDGAFTNFSSLEKISIPESVIYIGNAFSGCKSLTAVNINNLTSWCGITFEGVYSNPLIYAKDLTLGNEPISGNIILDEGITAIPAFTFYGSAITRLELPDSVTAIGASAFANCKLLSEAILSPNITSLPEGLFSGCGNLQRLVLPFVGGSPDTTKDNKTRLFGYIFGTQEYEGSYVIPQNYADLDKM